MAAASGTDKSTLDVKKCIAKRNALFYIERVPVYTLSEQR